jgi:genome maintenance exonuclease 1
MCEDYLNNDFDEVKHKNKFLPYVLFNQLKESVLQKVDNIYAQECGLYSDKYKVAGRVDCIAEYDGKLSIIDFKTSSKERSDEWNESYYIQASAYAEMFEERTEIEINQIAILVVTEDGIVQEFVKNKTEYLPMLTDTIKEWEEKNEMVFSIDINESV